MSFYFRNLDTFLITLDTVSPRPASDSQSWPNKSIFFPIYIPILPFTLLTLTDKSSIFFDRYSISILCCERISNIVSIEKDTKRISLSYKATLENPWEKIQDKIDVKIMNSIFAVFLIIISLLFGYFKL